MLADFSIVPVGKGSSMGQYIARVMDLVSQSGLPYKLNPMGTVVEGQWDEIMALIDRCREAVMDDAERSIITIRIDDRKGKTGMMESKVASVEKIAGREFSK